MTALRTFLHYPEEVLDYALPFALDAGDSLSPGAVWTIHQGDDQLQLPNTGEHIQYVAGNVAVLWVTGGTPGALYVLRCAAPTAEGRMLVDEIAIQVQV